MKRTLIASAVVLAATVALPAQAARLGAHIVGNTLNSFEDQSREIIVDVDGSGNLTDGDVFLGFLRIDDRIVPANPPASIDGQELYAAFSLEVTNSGAGTIEYIPTTVAGLQLTDVTGDAARMNTDFAAVYSDIGTDLIVTNLTAGAGDVLTQTSAVSSGTFELSLTSSEADDFFVTSGTGVSAVQAAGGLSLLMDSTFGLGFGANSIAAGLTVNENNTGFDFAELVPILGPAGLSFHQITLSSGSLSGACDLYDGSGDGDCGPPGNNATPASSNFLFGTLTTAAGVDYDYYGLSNNLDVSIVPIVPAPGPLGLFGAGLLAIGAMVRRRRMPS